MNLDWESVSQELLAGLVNAFALGLVVGALFWLALRFSRRSNAATRHSLAMLGLWLLALLPLATVSWHSLLPAPSPSPAATTFSAPLETAQIPRDLPAPAVAAAEPAPSPLSLAIAQRIKQMVWRSASDAAAEQSASAAATAESPTPTPVPATPAPRWFIPRDWALSIPPSLALWTVSLIAALLLIRLSRLAWQLGVVWMLKRDADAAPAHLQKMLEDAVSRSGSHRQVDLLVSEKAPVPMLVGFLRPAVVLPAHLLEQMQREELEQVIFHEAGHLTRWDDWSNLAQQLLISIAFYQPAAWWLTRLASLQREIACDDHVLNRGREARAYALLLTDFAGRARGHVVTAAPAAWSSKTQLKERIDMLLDTQRNTSGRMDRGRAGAIGTIAILLALAGIYGAPRVAVASEPPAIPATPAAPAIAAAPAAPAPAGVPAPVALIAPAPNGFGAKVTFPAPAPAAWAPAGLPPGTIVAQAAATTSPDQPRPKRRADSTEHLEARLDRLEAMLEKLLHEKEHSHNDHGHKAPHPEGPAAGIAENSLKIGEEAVRAAAEAMKSIDWGQINEEIKKATQAAMHEANMAMKHAKAEMKKHGEEHGKAAKQKTKARRNEIEAKKRALENEMNAVERRLQELEREEERIEEEQERLEEAQQRLEELQENEENEKQEQHEQQEQNAQSPQAGPTPAPAPEPVPAPPAAPARL